MKNKMFLFKQVIWYRIEKMWIQALSGSSPGGGGGRGVLFIRIQVLMAPIQGGNIHPTFPCR